MKFINNEQMSAFLYQNSNATNQLNNIKNEDIRAHARDLFLHLQKQNSLKQSMLFLVGPGKNGLLSLEIARLCAQQNIRVHLFIAQSTPSKRDLHTHFEKTMENVQLYYNLTDPLLKSIFQTVELVIDGLFATGISSDLDQHYTKIISRVNQSVTGEIISLFIPSGMKASALTFIRAHKVITIEFVPETLLSCRFPLRHIEVVTSTRPFHGLRPTSTIEATIPDTFKPTLEQTAHKYTRGHVLSLGGIDFFGASILTLKALQKVNAGMIQHMSIEAHHYPLLSQIPEIIFHDIEKTTIAQLSHATSLTGAVLGFGTQHSKMIQDHFLTLINIPHFFPIILDAGALSLFKTQEKPIKTHPLILTPHIGEFAQMIDLPVCEIEKNPIMHALTFAQKHDVILVLKSHQTLVTDGTRVWMNRAGNALLATPGSGDVLAGCIAGHLDQTLTPKNLFNRVCAAVYRHSKAADQLETQAYTNMTASHLIDTL